MYVVEKEDVVLGLGFTDIMWTGTWGPYFMTGRFFDAKDKPHYTEALTKGFQRVMFMDSLRY